MGICFASLGANAQNSAQIQNTAPSPTSMSAQIREYHQTNATQVATLNEDPNDWRPTEVENPNFDISIETSDKEIKKLLEQHLDLYQYRMLSDLTSLELQRLLEHTESNIRALTGTQGYFSPEIKIEVIPADQREDKTLLPLILIHVESGSITTIKEMNLEFEGDINARATDLLASSQKRRLRWGWAMRTGDSFSQSGWSNAKSNMVSRLTAQYYPAGKISASQATIDPQTNTASLSITLDSGSKFYLGEHKIVGLSRYSERMVRNFSRLRVGDNYLLEDMNKAQQRLSDSGYFDSVYLYVKPDDETPEAATIHVIVKEAYYQKMTIGPGFSTDNGPRLTFEYKHNEEPILGWQLMHTLQVDKDHQVLEGTLLAIPDDNFWRWNMYGKLQHQDANNEKTTSAQFRYGRSFYSDDFDKNYYIQFDKAKTENANTVENAQSISANAAWTLRRFNNLNMPRKGWGLGIEVGAGTTFGKNSTPFLRVQSRAMGFLPLKNRRNGRFVFRGEFGGVFAKINEPIPSPLLFRTGGDNTVRGYAHRYIGVNENNVTTSGRYMLVASTEYQRPILLNNRPSAFDWAIFADTGAISNKLNQLNLYTGIGAGLRWRSPVGPLNIDLGYGVKTEQFRLHFNIGFVF